MSDDLETRLQREAAAVELVERLCDREGMPDEGRRLLRLVAMVVVQLSPGAQRELLGALERLLRLAEEE